MKPNTAFIGILAIAGFGVYRMVADQRPETDGPKYAYSAESGFSIASSTGKPVVLIFSASWCGPCQDMKKRVYPSKIVQPYHDQFVWIYADVDKPENQALAQKYGVSGIPHVQLLGPDLKILGQTVGGVSPPDFANLLRSAKETLAAP
jgi:thiol:disulfide interchange protein